MDRQRQYIQLGHPSPENGTPSEQPNYGDDARLVSMCPSLYLAVYKGRKEETMALLLRQHGAATDYEAASITIHGQCNILEVTAERNSILHVAADQGHGELIRELYLRFKDQGLLSRRNTALDTPLHCAARSGHLSSVTVLLGLAQDCGEDKGILGCKNEAGDTALHLAARHGHGHAVEVLITAAASAAGELNNAGMSPLYLAVMSGSVQAVRAITTCSDASSLGPSKQNALHAAVFQSSKMVELLLEWRPALVDQVDSSGSSPLHFASSVGGRTTTVNAILRAAPPTTVYKKDSGGLSALHVAARMGHHSVVEHMLKICPDAAELRDDDGRTFLHAAVRKKRSSVVSLAVKSPMLRGLLNAQDRDGNTPLHLAVAAGAPGVVEALLRKGKVLPDVLNNDGHTPFDLAAGTNRFFTMVSLVVILFAYGARLRPQRQDHLTPWSGNIAPEIEKTSDGLVVVAGLVATAAFAAGFNVPGGYNETTGKANLAGNLAFESFLLLDCLTVAASVLAVILLVYGKVSRSAGSWKIFAVALHFFWVSLISLMLAFYVALFTVATTTWGEFNDGSVAIYVAICVCIYLLQCFILSWTGHPARSLRTIWEFIWQNIHSKGRHVLMKRQYPHAGASMFNFYLFDLITFIGFIGFGVMFRLGRRVDTSPSPAPSPL